MVNKQSPFDTLVNNAPSGGSYIRDEFTDNLIFHTMAQGYKLVEKKNLGKDSAEQPTKVYAIPKYNGYTDMDSLRKMIGARSTVSSADVKAVLDSLNFVLDMELQAGRIVRLGKFGNFRLSLSIEGANDKEGFDRSMIVGARMIFTAWRNPSIIHRLRAWVLSLFGKQTKIPRPYQF